jgi:leucyl-tRNA synthetase
MIEKVGVDALRLYVLFVAPPEKEVEWSDTGLEGSYRFLARVWRLVEPLCAALRGSDTPQPAARALSDADRALRRKTHDTIRRVSADLWPRVHLNTAISALMELVNEAYAYAEAAGALRIGRRAEDDVVVVERPETRAVLLETVEALLRLISLFAPHLAEELWERLGHSGGIVKGGWPEYDATVARAEELVIPVQINGKVRARLNAPVDLADEDLEALALAHPQVKTHVAGKTLEKVVIVRNRLVGIVVK